MNWSTQVEKMAHEEGLENVFVSTKSDAVLFGRKGVKSLRTNAVSMLLKKLVFRPLSAPSGAGSVSKRIAIDFSPNSDDTDQLFAGMYFAEPLVRVNAIKEGLPALLPSLLAQRMGISKERLYGTLGLPRATVERKVKDDEVLNPEESARVLGIARLIGQVQVMTGQRADFDASTWLANWLDTYLPAIQSKPAVLMDTTEGQILVSNLLARAESGAYS